MGQPLHRITLGIDGDKDDRYVLAGIADASIVHLFHFSQRNGTDVGTGQAAEKDQGNLSRQRAQVERCAVQLVPTSGGGVTGGSYLVPLNV
ncbi:MAG: hypothetical protein R3A10_01125 [Caldilineaceae bacterium]